MVKLWENLRRGLWKLDCTIAVVRQLSEWGGTGRREKDSRRTACAYFNRKLMLQSVFVFYQRFYQWDVAIKNITDFASVITDTGVLLYATSPINFLSPEPIIFKLFFNLRAKCCCKRFWHSVTGEVLIENFPPRDLCSRFCLEVFPLI